MTHSIDPPHGSIVQVCLSAALALDAFIDLCSCRRSMAMFRHARRLATVAVWVAVAGSWLAIVRDALF